MIAINDIQVGQRIKFQTHNGLDSNVYTGEVSGIVTYDGALVYSRDLVPYHKEVEKSTGSLPSIRELQFLVVVVKQGSLSSTKVFAKDWIIPSSVELVPYIDYIDIRFHGTDKSAVSDILSFLKSQGYRVSEIKK
jgi:hypothetical protein